MISPKIMNWEEKDDSTTVAALKTLLEEFWHCKQRVNDLKKRLEAAENIQNEYKDKLLERMEEEGLTRFDGEDCFVSISEKMYVITPKSKDDKEALFHWLKTQGVYWDYVSINHQSLQSLYKEQKAISNTGNFSLPGIGPERMRTELRAYKAKKKEK